MNKGRFEAFTDAIAAIIATIMVLEFKTPETYSLTGILAELPYLIAYSISFFFILVAWFNHHYIFSLVQYVSKRTYWINNAWLFTMSLLPVSTAWVGKFMTQQVPEWFYLFNFMLWSVAFAWLAWSVQKDLQPEHPALAHKIATMPVAKLLTIRYLVIPLIITIIISIYWPPIILVMSLVELIAMAFMTPTDADNIAKQF